MSTYTMSADLELDLGGRVRVLHFGIGELALLEKLLGSKDVVAYATGGGGDITFVVSAILAGLSRRQKGLTEPQVQDWIGKFTGAFEELKWQLLFAIVSGRPGEEAVTLFKKLQIEKKRQEDVRAKMAEDDEAGGDAGPLVPASSTSTGNPNS